MKKLSSRIASVLAAALPVVLLSATSFGASLSVKAPLTCSRGPNDSLYSAVLTVPSSVASGSTFTVRIDSLSSGIISHTGLNYIFDMTTDYLVPSGTTYVDGSVRVVPDTGTENARPGAKAWRDDAGIHLRLPAHIANGTSYTPPSIEFAVKVTAPPGGNVVLKFAHYEVMANAFLVGDVRTVCDPTPKPFSLAVIPVDPAHHP